MPQNKELLKCENNSLSKPDAHRDASRFIASADEKLTAFMELESAIRRLKANYGP
jgi:hypothetical protein